MSAPEPTGAGATPPPGFDPPANKSPGRKQRPPGPTRTNVMTDTRTLLHTPSPPAGKPRGGARENAGRPEMAPENRRKARQIYCTDAGWGALRTHLARKGFKTVGDFAESLLTET